MYMMSVAAGVVHLLPRPGVLPRLCVSVSALVSVRRWVCMPVCSYVWMSVGSRVCRYVGRQVCR